MVYMCGLYFALRRGQEHRSLSIYQLTLEESADGTSCLIYTENISINNPEGLQQRKLKPKVVVHHTNLNNPSRCFVMFVKAYIAHHPKDVQHDAFYLTPICNQKTNIWYSTMPSIDGYKTNHSLCVTVATRLFRQGVDEQLIMLRTGHRSIDGVRAYKCVSDGQPTKGSICLYSMHLLPQWLLHQLSHLLPLACLLPVLLNLSLGEVLWSTAVRTSLCQWTTTMGKSNLLLKLSSVCVCVCVFFFQLCRQLVELDWFCAFVQFCRK